MQVFYIFLSSVLGYITLRFTSHPNSKLNKKLPRIRFKNAEIFPSTKIIIRGKIIHFHHWFNFTLLLCISIFVTGGILDSWLTRGFLFGGIIQGLRFSDRNIFQKTIK
jgi:hypothetical protein